MQETRVLRGFLIPLPAIFSVRLLDENAERNKT